jgi:hypothetical protein
MTSRFPVPWRIVERPNGFAVEDATGKQIGVFYGRAPDIAGRTGIMTMDEARQMAIDFRKIAGTAQAGWIARSDARKRAGEPGECSEPLQAESVISCHPQMLPTTARCDRAARVQRVLQ